MADYSRFPTRFRERVKYHFCFSKAVFFAFGSFFGRAVVDYAFLGYMFVLIEEYKGNLKTAALITTLFDGVSPFLDSLLVRLSCRLMPYLTANLITNANFVAGMLMLWFTAPYWSTEIFFSALALLVVGRTGDIFTSRFLFHYIRSEDETIDVRNVSDRTDVWRSIARCPGAIVGLWISELDVKSTMKISAIVTIIGYVFLLCGILYYKCQGNERSPGEILGSPQEINQSNQECSLVMQAMQLLKLLLLYIPFLIYYVVEGAGNTFFYNQLDNLDDHIGKIFFSPASSLYAIQKGSGLVTSLVMEIFIITDLWRESEWKCAKLILGMFVCFSCCMCSWYVESRRLDSKLSMSNLWMVPQFVLLAIAQNFVEDGLEDVFFSHVKKSMHLWESAFLYFLKGLGASLSAVFIVAFGKWIRDNIDDSRLDRYYLLLAILTILAIPVFICLWKFYAPIIRTENENKGGLNSSRSHSQLPAESPAELTSRSSAQASTRDPSNCNSFFPQAHPASEVHHQQFPSHLETNNGTKEENRENSVEVKAASAPQAPANYSLIDKWDTSRSSFPNSNLSVLKRSLTSGDQPRSAANVHYQYCFNSHLDETNKGAKEENHENMVELKAASAPQSSANYSSIDKLDTSRSSFSNSNSSVLKRSLTSGDQPRSAGKCPLSALPYSSKNQ